MNWIPLRVLAGPIQVLLMVMSVFALFRGHNEPGGGFIGGLLAACGLLVRALALGPEAGRAWLRISPVVIMGLGVMTAAASGLVGLLVQGDFLSGQWWFTLPVLGKVGSVLVFDLGVYLVVFGAAVQLLLWLLDVPDAGGEAS